MDIHALVYSVVTKFVSQDIKRCMSKLNFNACQNIGSVVDVGSKT